MTYQGAPESAARPVLARMQAGLESLYRVDTQLDVGAFMVDEAGREAMLAGSPGARHSKEQLLVSHDRDELNLALFIAGDALSNLERHDPTEVLDEGNFADFCLAVEGVSHFVYVAVCAQQDRPVTALELELQAEVDKFVSCVLLHADGADQAALWRRLLFDDVVYAPGLDAEERDRYVEANAQASRYAAVLERRYLRADRTCAMLEEVRRFYRLGLGAKLGFIAGAEG